MSSNVLAIDFGLNLPTCWGNRELERLKWADLRSKPVGRRENEPMIKKVVGGVLLVVVVVSAGLFFWVRAVFTQDAVRTAIAAQLSRSIGQKVTIGSIGAGIYPRVTVNLGEVSIGQPARIQVRTLHVGADFGALLSRRIEHASLRLTGARVELPIPDFAMASSSPARTPGAGQRSAPVEI